MEADLVKPRRPWLAGLLSLFLGVPVGQLYAGRPKRAIVLWILCSIFLPLAMYLLIRIPLNRLLILALAIVILSVPLFLAADAFLIARRDRQQQLQRYQRWWIYLLVWAGVSVVGTINGYLFRSHLTAAFIVPSGSMAPTIQYNDRILVDKLAFKSSQLKRNDLAIHWSLGPNPQLNVKRVIGLPGETVEIREEQLLIDGKPVTDEFGFIDIDQPLIPELTNYGPMTIPAGSFFVLGDNRRNSLDSRMNGPIPADRFQGIARMIYWSNDYTFLEHPRRPPEWKRGAIRWDRIGKRLD